MDDDGSSDSSDEEDYQDESVALTSEEAEVPTTTTQDTIRESVRGNAKKERIQMEKIQYQAPSVDFIACVEEGTEDRCDWTPYMYFKQFVTDEMLQETAEQTHLYSAKMRASQQTQLPKR